MKSISNSFCVNPLKERDFVFKLKSQNWFAAINIFKSRKKEK